MIKKYELRCKFEYLDKKEWCSQWNKTGESKEDAAYMQTKNNLLYAVIEGKDILTRKTVRLVEHPGIDFCNFQWVAVAAVPINGTGKLNSRNIGLTMVTRDKNIIVLCDGSIYIENRDNKEDNLMHYGRKEF